MPSLILIKHSLPEIDPSAPAKNWRLSGEGRRRCIPLAERLAAYRPSAVVASIEPKATETGRIVATHLGLPFETAVDLRENDRTGLPFYDSAAGLEAVIARFFDQPDRPVMGQETANAAHARFAAAIDTVLARYPEQTVAIVAHGTVITLLITRLTHQAPMPLWRSLDLPSFVVLALPEMNVQYVSKT